MMILDWSSRSPFARKVMIAAHELGLDGPIETRGEVVTPLLKSETLRAAHPLGQLPALLLADGTALYDSHVICDYLDGLALRSEALADGMLDKALKWLDERFHPEAMRAPEKIDGIRRDLAAALNALEAESGSLSPTLGNLGSIGIAAALAYLDFRFAAELPWREGRAELAR